MKGALGLRPVFGHREDRIRAHVQRCWPALLLLRVVENATDDSGRAIRHELERMHLVTLATAEGQIARRSTLTQDPFMRFSVSAGQRHNHAARVLIICGSPAWTAELEPGVLCGPIAGSRSPMERDLAAGQVGGLVVGVVDPSVVVSAEQSSVFDVGGSALGPRDVVVGVAHRGWPVAVLGGAALVADGHPDALGFAVEAAFAADVEDLRLRAEDDRDDPGGTGQSAGFGCGDLATGVQGARPKVSQS